MECDLNNKDEELVFSEENSDVKKIHYLHYLHYLHYQSIVRRIITNM